MTNNPTRRNFLCSAAALATAAALPARALASRAGGEVFTNASTAIFSQGLMSEEHLRTLVGTLFMTFLPEGGVAWLRLKAVEKIKTGEKHAKFDFLHLRFSTGGAVLAQGSYLLDHGTLGRFALFVVPGRTPQGEPTCGAVLSQKAS